MQNVYNESFIFFFTVRHRKQNIFNSSPAQLSWCYHSNGHKQIGAYTRFFPGIGNSSFMSFKFYKFAKHHS